MPLKSLLSRQKSSLVGIDIGTHTVKAVCLSKNGVSYQLDHLAVEHLPADAVETKGVQDPARVSKAVHNAWYQSAAKSTQCVLAVPATSTFSRLVHMPAGLSEQELESQVWIEAGQIVPFNLDEVNLDFQIIGEMPGDASQLEVLLVATRKENIHQLLSVIDEAELELAIVDIDKYALLNAYIELLETADLRNKTVALVHIGADTMMLLVIREQHELYYKDIDFGVAQLQRRIARDADQNADIEMLMADPDDAIMQQHIIPFRQHLFQQFNRAAQAFSSAIAYRRIEEIVLSGGGARTPGLAQYLREELEMPVQVADVGRQITIGNKVSRRLFKSQGPALVQALGLALRGVR